MAPTLLLYQRRPPVDDGLGQEDLHGRDGQRQRSSSRPILVRMHDAMAASPADSGGRAARAPPTGVQRTALQRNTT